MVSRRPTVLWTASVATVDPANGYLSDDSRTPMIIGIVFLVGFGIISVGTWAYFRFRPERAHTPPDEASA